MPPTIRTPATILATPCGAMIDTGEVGPLVVAARTFPRAASVASVRAGTARAEEVVLTSDGRGYTPGWHDGPVDPNGRDVYVERWTAEGRAFHGWIDAGSRRLVQAG